MRQTPDPQDLTALVSNCAACSGLCCVAPGFDAGDDFAFDKRALAPCRHLGNDNLCRIHETLDDQGFKGCSTFDCKGAGPYVMAHIFPRGRWRKDRAVLEDISEAYRRMRAICDMIELIRLAQKLPLSAPQEQARQDMLDRLLPKIAWTSESLADAEAAGIISDAHKTLQSFRDAVSQA